MAAKGVDIDRESFNCPICLDLLKNPVTIPCGHSYCMTCVSTHWDGEGGKSYSCPQCRQSFTRRPVLVINTMLDSLMWELQKNEPRAPRSPDFAGDGDVSCDLCSGRKVRAAKSCLQCLVSYCVDHLQPHHDVAALQKHELVSPTENLQENICSRHDEVMKMFCRTDQQCICYLCSVDQHKGHDTVTATVEMAEKEGELDATTVRFFMKLDQKNKDLQQLQQHMKNSSCSADAAVEQSDQDLKELISILEKRISEVKQQIRSQQEAEEQRVKELQEKVLQEKIYLRGKLSELSSITGTDHPVQFLLKFPSLCKISETPDSVTFSLTPPPFQDMVGAAVSKLRSALEEISLLDPPAAIHKPKVNTSVTDAPPAGAQGTAAPQTTSQREEPTVTLPPQSLPPHPVIFIPPPPQLQKSEVTKRLDFSSGVHKRKLNTPATDAPPAGAQGTAAPQPTSQREGLTVTLPPQPVTFIPPPPQLQNSEVTKQLDFSSAVHKRKLNTPGDGPEGVQLIEPPEGCSYQEWFKYSRETIRVYPLGYSPSYPFPRHGPPPPPPEDAEAWPALPHHNLKLKKTTPLSPQPSSSQSQASKDTNYLQMKKYARKITWDPRSLNCYMELSDENLIAKRVKQCQNLRPHVFRFSELPQVVSKETLTGQCYFEVVVHTRHYKSVTLAVAYKDMKRDGTSNESSFGKNSKSWALEFSRDHSVIWHNANKVEIPMGDGFLIGVFVDYKAGILSFYREMNHVYTFKTKFTQPLLAGIRLENVGDAAQLCRRMFSDKSK